MTHQTRELLGAISASINHHREKFEVPQMGKLKNKKNDGKEMRDYLWRRGLCDRIRSRGILGSSRSACTRCCQQRLCASALGVGQGPHRPSPSKGPWPWRRRTSASPSLPCSAVKKKHRPCVCVNSALTTLPSNISSQGR